VRAPRSLPSARSARARSCPGRMTSSYDGLLPTAAIELDAGREEQTAAVARVRVPAAHQALIEHDREHVRERDHAREVQQELDEHHEARLASPIQRLSQNQCTRG